MLGLFSNHVKQTNLFINIIKFHNLLVIDTKWQRLHKYPIFFLKQFIGLFSLKLVLLDGSYIFSLLFKKKNPKFKIKTMN